MPGTPLMRRCVAMAILLIAAGCQPRGEAPRTAEDAPWRQPGDQIDSILPMATYLARFREGVPQVESFADGVPARAALIARFGEALEARDTTALRRLLVTRAEFAWLIFPAHIYSRPPYEMDPALFWFQITNESSSGSVRLLRRLAGRPLGLELVGCQADTVQARGSGLSLWGPCTVRFSDSAGTRVTGKLFGTIIEWQGMAKFLSYANDY